MKIITIVWDEDEDCLSVNHEGCNRYEAVGMMSQAIDLLGCWEMSEVEDEPGTD